MIEIHEAKLALLIDGLLDISSYGIAMGQSKVTKMADTTLERFRQFRWERSESEQNIRGLGEREATQESTFQSAAGNERKT